jgi:PAS domain S-box-containing protein
LKPSSTDSPFDQTLSDLDGEIDQISRVFNSRYRGLKGVEPSIPASISQSLSTLKDRLSRLGTVADEYDVEKRNLEALVDIGQVINSSLDSAHVLNEVIDTIIRLTGAERAFLVMPDELGTMEMVVARNWEKESVEPDDYRISTTIVSRVLSEGEAVLTTNASDDPRFGEQQSIIAYNLRSILCVPLKVKGKLTGVLYADNSVREGLFTERDRRLLSAFANQAAVALENAMLFASVQQTLGEVTELKNLMEDVFASIASGVITTDVADEITLCNRAAEEILGISSDELLGSSVMQTLSPFFAELTEKVEEVKQKDQRFLDVEIQTEVEQRGEVDLRLNITPLKSVDQQTRGVAIVVDDLTEKKSLEAQRRLFERMVSPAVIDQLDPDSLQLGGKRAEITILFADIRGYTSFSESIDPETLMEVLNQHLSVAADAILKEEGTIDKFSGDAVMAWFNAPIPQSDHVLRAVRAAVEIRHAIEIVHQQIPEGFQLNFGVGVHLGDALLGLVGTHKRLEYTAIGDSVNIAKRLQENARPGQILVSRSVAEVVHADINLQPVPPIQAEGKDRPLEVFEVLGVK